jgi:hypothetical protein
VTECVFHRKAGTLSVLARCCHVMRIAGQSVTSNLSVYPSTSLFRVFKFLERISVVLTHILSTYLQHNHAGTFSDNEARSILIKWTTRFSRVFVPLGG